MIYSVPKSWDGQTCVILAGGPSLRGFNLKVFGQLSEYPRIITINDSWRLAPRADVNYFCDAEWWIGQIARNLRSLDNEYGFHDLIYKGFWVAGNHQFNDHPQVRSLRFTGQIGLETDPSGLRHGSNSGYQAINLAYLYGARKIILLGYDMKCAPGRTHWHEEPRQEHGFFSGVLKNTMLPLFEHIAQPLKAAGVRVINSTPDSALNTFEKLPLDEALSATADSQPKEAEETITT